MVIRTTEGPLHIRSGRLVTRSATPKGPKKVNLEDGLLPSGASLRFGRFHRDAEIGHEIFVLAFTGFFIGLTQE
jgi:hypothetical protein